ncbi:histidinol-phosphatase [Sphingoaurantiacus capsulatus]|uniref:Histidinol-phosphatase n=1 Tax=Sphingoaurantiacus capsulatus TaxID=1771310 RepID=A0ABV7XB61_9SPHN
MIDADILILAERLADAAGAAVRPYFRQPFDIETKGDLSPVTAADRAAETAMRAIIEAERPQDGIIGEEFGRVREDARYVWVFDPIDGTRAFITGRPLFGTLIALLDDGKPVLGVIDQPIIGDRWVGAEGRPTLLNGLPVRTRACASLAEARVGTTSPQAFGEAPFAAFERLRPHVCDVIYGGDCYNYGVLAAGHLDLVVESGLQLYDFAALVPVIEGAGGRMVDWQGRPLDRRSDGSVVAAGDAELIPAALKLLNG